MGPASDDCKDARDGSHDHDHRAGEHRLIVPVRQADQQDREAEQPSQGTQHSAHPDPQIEPARNRRVAAAGRPAGQAARQLAGTLHCPAQQCRPLPTFAQAIQRVAQQQADAGEREADHADDEEERRDAGEAPAIGLGTRRATGQPTQRDRDQPAAQPGPADYLEPGLDQSHQRTHRPFDALGNLGRLGTLHPRAGRWFADPGVRHGLLALRLIGLEWRLIVGEDGPALAARKCRQHRCGTGGIGAEQLRLRMLCSTWPAHGVRLPNGGCPDAGAPGRQPVGLNNA